MPTTLTGVQQAEVGPRYDVAVGVDLGASTRMYGYVLAQGQAWTETTDIQDNDRLIQIASPNSSDRFTFFPKVSQGDWSGGERQVIFVDANRYYSSQKLETGYQGHLYLYGLYQNMGSAPANVGNVSSAVRNVTFEEDSTTAPAALIATLGGSAGNAIRVSFAGSGPGVPPTLLARIIGTSTDAVREFLHGPARIYAAITGAGSPGIFQTTAAGSWAKVGTDLVAQQNNPFFGNVMGYTQNALYYVLSGSAPNKINNLLNPTGGGGAGATVLTQGSTEEGTITLLTASPSGLFFVTNGATHPALDPSYSPARFYSWDGQAASGTLLEELPIGICDAIQASGVTFILGYSSGSTFFAQPVLLAYFGGQLTVYDDYRYVPTDFQGVSSIASPGSLATDGTYLYMAWPGLRTKRYDLRQFPQAVISDIGHPGVISGLPQHTVAAAAGNLIEVTPTPAGFYRVSPQGPGGQCENSDTGQLITSYFDMATPSTIKTFRSFELELNAALTPGAAVGVAYQRDAETGFPGSLTMTALSNNNLIGFFPTNTKAVRIQLRLTLTAGSSSGVSPDIKSYSLSARLARVWKFTVMARRQLMDHSGALDQQGARSQDLMANLVNVYQQAAGNAVLFVPDSTSATGVSQVNAVMESYEISSKAPGPNTSEQAPYDMEGDISCTFVERL